MTQTKRETIEQLEDLAATYRSRLRVLARQMAQYGIAEPAHIVLDHEQAERDLARALADLNRLRDRPTDERPPYLGLTTFQERDSELFFGREALIVTLVEKVVRTPFLAVLGASGSGKSSVVRTGLISELRGGALPGSECWRYAIFKPGDRPLDALATTLACLQGGDLGSVLALSRQLAESDRALLLAADLLLDGQADGRLVLIIDQAEELWTFMSGDAAARTAYLQEQQAPFLRLLLTAAESAQATGRSAILIILTMRADFLHRAAEHPQLARWVGEHNIIVSPMTPDELRRAIYGPTKIGGYSFEPGLVDALVDEVEGEPGTLPLLQYTLLELW